MIPRDVVEIIKDKVISTYTRAYGKINKPVDYKSFVGYFEPYVNYNMIGDYNCFIIYDVIGTTIKTCKIIDVVSTTGKVYHLWGKLVRENDIILAQAYDDLPIVKRAYRKLGGIPTGIYNDAGQQYYVFDKRGKQ